MLEEPSEFQYDCSGMPGREGNKCLMLEKQELVSNGEKDARKSHPMKSDRYFRTGNGTIEFVF